MKPSPAKFLIAGFLGLALLGFLVAALFGLPLCAGVWLPDVVSAPVNTLAERHVPGGASFRVVQYWNRVDFYTTQLRITTPDGKTKVHMLDGDDSKSWSVRLFVDEKSHMATVILGGGRNRIVDWK